MSPLTAGLFALACLLPEHETPPPPLSVANGLPRHAVALALYQAASAHLQWAEQWWGRYEWDGCHRHVAEAYDWCEAWRDVAEATDPDGSEWHRRRALARLVERWGWRAVLTSEFPTPELLRGEPPPCVPNR